MKKYRNKPYSGFTLAEVLIALMIIGIIAASTIPALQVNVQDAQLKSAWKKTFSDLNQATMQIMRNNGGTFKGVCSDNDSDCFKNAYLPYISYTKNCTSGNFVGNCWHPSGVTKILSGALQNRYPAPGVVLSNGQFLRFLFYSSSCTSQSGNMFYCGGLLVDVNGSVGPNTVGRDIFETAVTENGLKPDGMVGGGSETDCNTDPPSGTGWGCAARYLYQ